MHTREESLKQSPFHASGYLPPESHRQKRPVRTLCIGSVALGALQVAQSCTGAMLETPRKVATHPEATQLAPLCGSFVPLCHCRWGIATGRSCRRVYDHKKMAIHGSQAGFAGAGRTEWQRLCQKSSVFSPEDASGGGKAHPFPHSVGRARCPLHLPNTHCKPGLSSRTPKGLEP